MLKTTALVHLVYQLAQGAVYTNHRADLAKIAAFCLGVLFCCHIAQMDLPPASVIRILLLC